MALIESGKRAHCARRQGKRLRCFQGIGVAILIAVRRRVKTTTLMLSQIAASLILGGFHILSRGDALGIHGTRLGTYAAGGGHAHLGA
jgi:hypothetical protein